MRLLLRGNMAFSLNNWLISGDLQGISSSKISGVPGIGPKSATQLINQFSTLEALYERLDEVPENGARN